MMTWDRLLAIVSAISITVLAATQIPVAMNAIRFNQCFSFADGKQDLTFCMGDPQVVK